MNKNLCLIGNPNCGKTTLFNSLTGTYQKVGNWAGVTIEKKLGKYRKNKDVNIIDLPGLYSLNPTSVDEQAVLDYLNNAKPEVIINVLDGTNLERNLYLTCQLTKLNIPMVLAVNFSDQLYKNNVKINVKELEKEFNVPVIEISALKNKNLDKLISASISATKKPNVIEQDEYEYVSKIITKIITEKQLKSQILTEKVDKLLLNKYLCFPIFAFIVVLIYFLSIKVGGVLGDKIKIIFNNLASNTENSLLIIGAPEWSISLICNAVINGFASVISFLPQILVLFILLTILEESGYSARLSFVLDGIFSKFGLSGKSFIPLMVSCGCIVPGILSTKTIENKKEKVATIIASTLMPCGAKMAVFGWFSHKFFNGSALIATSLYFLSFFVALVIAFLLNRKNKKNNNEIFLLEIPPLRAPSIKNILYVLWEKIKDFLVKAGTVVFGVSVLVWFLQNFGIKGYTDGDIESSFLYFIGNIIKYVFYPLGFGNWQASVSVISGILAKEAVIESLQLISGDISSLFSNNFAVYSFMTFVLLSPPCFASIITAKREFKNKKSFYSMLAIEIVSAYIVALLINCVGNIIKGNKSLIFYFIIAIIVLGLIISIIVLFKPCNKCKICKENCNKYYEK